MDRLRSGVARPMKRDAGSTMVSSDRAWLARNLYQTMLRIRVFEEAVGHLFTEGKLPGFVHLSLGQEAVAAGACAALRRDDVIATNHRGHGHCLAKGADPRRMMAELFGNQSGYSRGVGGSMHIADLDQGVLGANGIVGASILIASGAAFAFQVRHTDRVAVAFFGDGAANEGAFHEGLNLAALWRLPVIFLCENNGYAEMTPESVHHAGAGIAERGAAYGISGRTVDGTDALAVYDQMCDAVQRCRRGEGPVLLEAHTHRWRGHFEGDDQKYRSSAELEQVRQWDPIVKLSQQLLDRGWAERGWLDTVRSEIDHEIDAATTYGAAGSPLDFEAMMSQVYRDPGSPPT